MDPAFVLLQDDEWTQHLLTSKKQAHDYKQASFVELKTLKVILDDAKEAMGVSEGQCL